MAKRVNKKQSIALESKIKNIYISYRMQKHNFNTNYFKLHYLRVLKKASNAKCFLIMRTKYWQRPAVPEFLIGEVFNVNLPQSF